MEADTQPMPLILQADGNMISRITGGGGVQGVIPGFPRAGKLRKRFALGAGMAVFNDFCF